MTNIRPPAVRDANHPDPRVARTTRALGDALIELLKGRPFEEITVQQILDRAGVGRTTFYTHYRNKDDVLASSYERLFASLEGVLLSSASSAPRLFPVREFLEHLREAQDVGDALRRDGRMHEVWELCAAHAARMIERRISTGAEATIPPAMVARMLAGALMEGIRWWMDHPVSLTPAQFDAAFHRMAGETLRSASRR